MNETQTTLTSVLQCMFGASKANALDDIYFGKDEFPEVWADEFPEVWAE
jgi:hypothetical protein